MTDAILAAAMEHFAGALELNNERLTILAEEIAGLRADIATEPEPSKIEPLLQEIVASLARIEAQTAARPNGHTR